MKTIGGAYRNGSLSAKEGYGETMKVHIEVLKKRYDVVE